MFEPVLTMVDYYDGPRRGIAEYRGRPQLYQSLWGPEWGDLADIDSDEFHLVPVDSTTLALALEDWAIFRRWEDAHRAGRAPESSCPALPAERARHEEIAALLRVRLVVDPAGATRRRGCFRARRDPSCPLEVEWGEPTESPPGTSPP